MKNNLSIKIILAICAIALFINVGSYGVIESSDARYAEIGREMFNSGDYLHPNLLDIHHYHKPPITYQLTALGYELFGINAFGARFFLQIAILIQLILVYSLTCLLFENKKTGIWAAVIYFSFPILLISSRNLTTDAFLTTFTLLSIYSWVKYRKSGLVKWLYFFTISLGIGFLTKGPVVFIVPVIFVLFFNRTEKSKTGFTIHHIISWLLFLVIASSWFVYLSLYNPDFIDYFLGRQTADRFSKNVFGRTEPFWYFLVYSPLLGLPWFIVLVYLIIKLKSLFSKNSIYLALLMAAVVPLIFFSISSSKRILYILPIYSLLAVLTAQLLTKASNGNIKITNRIVLIFSLLILFAFAATLFVNFEMNFPLIIGIASIFLIPIIFWIYKFKNIRSKAIIASMLISLFLVISSSTIFSVNQLKVNATKPITDFIINTKLNDREIYVFNRRVPSVAFGLNKSIISLNDGHESLARETQFENDLNWKKYLIDMRDKNDVNSLKQRLIKPSILILFKYPLPEKFKWLLNYYKNKKVMENWTIYY